MGSISESTSRDVDILIIGGGLSGLYALYALRKLRPSPTIKLIEAGSDFGGTWHYNRYPGARVDSEWPQYQLSIPEVWKDWSYEDRFPDHKQVRAYINHVVDILDARRDALLNTVIDGIHWDSSTRRWTSHAHDGRSFTSHYLLICTGSSYKRHFPDFKGLNSFKGQLLHSSAFPERDIDMTGKRVGIIGAGATGVQLVQELAKEDCQLINFIRTPNTAFPMVRRKISKEEEAKLKSEYSSIFRGQRTSMTGFVGVPGQVSWNDYTPAERIDILQKCWDLGGFAYLSGQFCEYQTDEDVNDYVYKFWADKVRARITDPVKRDIMAPLPKQNYIGTKRPSLEHDYYEMIDQPNVKLVDLKKSGIDSITQTGVLTDDGTLHELDVLILATGFDALNGSQMALNIHDKHGVSLRDKWSKGTQTYLGLTIPDFPNAFLSYGPQGPAALGNAPPIIETGVDWIAEVIQRMEDEGIETIDARPEFAKKWRDDIQVIHEMTFMAKEDSWWNGANIPGKAREQLNYLGGLNNYRTAILDALEGWKGFDLEMKDKKQEV